MDPHSGARPGLCKAAGTARKQQTMQELSEGQCISFYW